MGFYIYLYHSRCTSQAIFYFNKLILLLTWEWVYRGYLPSQELCMWKSVYMLECMCINDSDGQGVAALFLANQMHFGIFLTLGKLQMRLLYPTMPKPKCFLEMTLPLVITSAVLCLHQLLLFSSFKGKWMILIALHLCNKLLSGITRVGWIGQLLQWCGGWGAERGRKKRLLLQPHNCTRARRQSEVATVPRYRRT